VGDFLGILAGGLAGEAALRGVAFFGAFFAGAFLLAALAFDAAVVPVAAFFAGARLLAGVAFFAGAALALALPARTFLGAALGLAGIPAFFAGALGVLLAVEVGLVVFALVVAVLETGLAVLEAGLEATLEVGLFSLADVSTGLDLGANLTLPEGPLGRTKTPFSAPVLMAFASWVD